MIDLRNASRAELTYHGWRLGTFQAAAIFNPISAALLFITSPLCPECASPSQARSGPWEMCSQGHTFVRES